MVDIAKTIKVKTNQLNADDLIGKGKLITTITKVSENTVEQPIKVEHTQGLPWYPCTGMRRILFQAWGGDGRKYVGRKVELFREPTVKFQGAAVGGIEISGLSHIEADTVFMVTVSRGRKKALKVRKLDADIPTQPPAAQPVETVRPDLLKLAEKAAKEGMEAYAAFFKDGCNAKERVTLQPYHEGYKAEAAKADIAKHALTEMEGE